MNSRKKNRNQRKKNRNTRKQRRGGFFNLNKNLFFSKPINKNELSSQDKLDRTRQIFLNIKIQDVEKLINNNILELNNLKQNCNKNCKEFICNNNKDEETCNQVNEMINAKGPYESTMFCKNTTNSEDCKMYLENFHRKKDKRL